MLDDNEIQNDCFYCLACNDCDNDSPISETILWVGAIIVTLIGVCAVFV